MSNLQQAAQNNQQIEAQVKSNNFGDQVKKMIQQNKVLTFKFEYLNQPLQNANTEELKVARQFCELNVLYSIGAKNIEEFESASVRLRVFYENYQQFIPQSQDQAQFVSLYLLYLLSFNKISEFHTQLELLPIQDFSNKYIKFVLDLERSITVGNYQEVLNSQQNTALPLFSLFLDRIIHTIRYEVARSAEKSYKNLQVNEALHLFNFKAVQELQAFIQEDQEKQQENGYVWKLENNQLSFNSMTSENVRFDSNAIIQKSLAYAHELEKII